MSVSSQHVQDSPWNSMLRQRSFRSSLRFKTHSPVTISPGWQCLLCRERVIFKPKFLPILATQGCFLTEAGLWCKLFLFLYRYKCFLFLFFSANRKSNFEEVQTNATQVINHKDKSPFFETGRKKMKTGFNPFLLRTLDTFCIELYYHASWVDCDWLIHTLQRRPALEREKMVNKYWARPVTDVTGGCSVGVYRVKWFYIPATCWMHGYSKDDKNTLRYGADIEHNFLSIQGENLLCKTNSTKVQILCTFV